MSDFIPTHYEEITSQIPALHLLMHLGYEYLLPVRLINSEEGKKIKLSSVIFCVNSCKNKPSPVLVKVTPSVINPLRKPLRHY